MSDTPEKGNGGIGLSIKRKAAALPAQKDVKKRWMIAGGVAVGLAVVISTSMQDTSSRDNLEKQRQAAADKKAMRMVEVTPSNVEAKSWQAQSQADIQALKAELQALKEQNKKSEQKAAEEPKVTIKNVEQAPTALTPDVVAPPKEGVKATPTPSAPLPPPLPPVRPGDKLNSSGGVNMKGAAVPVAPVVEPVRGGQNVFDAPVLEKRSAVGGSSDPLVAKAEGEEEVTGKVSYKKNPYAGFVPPGAFAPVALLHGLDAGTSAATQSNPQPVLVRIQNYATLPGSAKYQLKSCFSTGSGYGEMSSERVYFRLAQLSCVDQDNRLVLAQEINGYIVDSDGKLGLRGNLVDRQGAKLAKALLAGFAQGLGQALSGAQSTMVSSALGAASSIAGADALRASGLNGVSSASQQMAQFYLKEAQAMFPVIEIESGRTGSIVLTKGVSLQWNDTGAKFTKEIKPDQS